MQAQVRRWVSHVVTWSALALVLSPLARSGDYQSVPLSHYSMYATDRGPVVAFPTMQLRSSLDSDELTILPMTALDTDDPLVAVSRLLQAIAGGASAMERLCRDALHTGQPLGPEASIEIATEQHDAVARLADRPSLVGRTVHHRCAGRAG